jgi:hypothetical protein
MSDATMPWRCFHCDEVFHDREPAAEHFGEGNYELEVPLCIEAATAEMKALVLTNREMFREMCKERDACEQAEYERGCWEQAARMFLKRPNANWHDLA